MLPKLFFESYVHAKRKTTVPIMLGGTSRMRFILAISVVIDVMKLPLFSIFKGIPGGSFNRQLPSMLPGCIAGYFQAKVWTHDRTIEVSCNKIYKPYIAGCSGNGGLLLENSTYHK